MTHWCFQIFSNTIFSTYARCNMWAHNSRSHDERKRRQMPGGEVWRHHKCFPILQPDGNIMRNEIFRVSYEMKITSHLRIEHQGIIQTAFSLLVIMMIIICWEPVRDARTKLSAWGHSNFAVWCVCVWVCRCQAMHSPEGESPRARGGPVSSDREVPLRAVPVTKLAHKKESYSSVSLN